MIATVVYDSNGWIMIAMYLIVTIVGVLLMLMCDACIKLKIYMLGTGFRLASGLITLGIFYKVITSVHAIF